MYARVLLFAIFLLISACAEAQTDTGPAPDISTIHHLIDQYAKAVDTLDPKLISRIWSHAPEVSFIYPLGEERGFDAIEQHVFEGVMGGMFSTRDLRPEGVAVHVIDNTAWFEFHWICYATMRRDGSAVTTRGVETQIYRKDAGKWSLVHIHYSEDRQSAPEHRGWRVIEDGYVTLKSYTADQPLPVVRCPPRTESRTRGSRAHHRPASR